MRTITKIGLPVMTLALLCIAGTLIAQDNSAKKHQPLASAADGSGGAMGVGTGSTSSPSTPVTSSDHAPFVRVMTTSGAPTYALTRSQGVFVSLDGGATWQQRNDGLPHRMVYPFSGNEIETLTAIGVDPVNPQRVAVTTSLGMYYSVDAGLHWTAIPLGEPIKSVAYVTSVAVSPWDADTFALGTSFDAAFETTDGGRTWTALSDNLKFLYRGAGFYEEVDGLAYSPVDAGVLYLGAGYGGDVFRSNGAHTAWAPLNFPKLDVDSQTFAEAPKASGGTPAAGTAPASFAAPATGSGRPLPNPITDLTWAHDASGWSLRVDTTADDWSYALSSAAWADIGGAYPTPPIGPEKASRVARAADKSGIYLADVNASGENLDKKIALMKANGLNSVVVDVKDDFGRLTYNSHLPMAEAVGAVHPIFNLDDLIKKAHANGIYVIGRVVVFKDEQLYFYQDKKYAIWNASKNASWGNLIKEADAKTGETKYVQREFWVDPYSEDVWRYNVDIAKELQARGVDEIQFDYIRFPSDGDLASATYRFKKPGMSRIDALESFMIMARQALTVPISVDLYGFNTWYRMGNWIGQNIEMLSSYVDVVCPMDYPSHFPGSFMSAVPYLERARRIYYQGTRRAQEIVRGRADIRPFVQSFLLTSGELKMDTPEYSAYLRDQLEGAQAAHSSGFTLWNASNIYYMVTFPLTPYVAPSSGYSASAAPSGQTSLRMDSTRPNSATAGSAKLSDSQYLQ